MARPSGRRSRLATRRPAPTLAAQGRKTAQPPPSWLARAASRLNRPRLLLIAALVACATLPNLNILLNGFVYDDETQVLQNPYIRSFRYLKEIFTTNVWSFTGAAATNDYRPMMTFGYLVCHQLFGMQAYGFHLVSLLLHVFVVCLVFALTERLTGDRVWAFVAGALFALHPVHTESVAWIAAVTDLELTLFYLLTFRFYLAVARPGGRRSAPMLAAMVFAFILALFSKEQAMTLPALATFYEHFYRDDRSETSRTEKLARYGPLWLVSVAYVLYRIQFLGALAPRQNLPQLTPQQIVLSAIALVGQYVGKVLWPVRLCFFYTFHPSTSLFEPGVLAGLLALIALAGLFLVCGRTRERNLRFACFAILWFLATLAPVLNAHWLATNVFAERYLYLPSVGFAWLVGLGASKLWSLAGPRPAQRRALLLAGVAVGLLCTARIAIRNRDWNNDIVLYTRTLELSPDADIILDDLASAYLSGGAIDKAESVWKSALAVNPNNVDVLNNLGVLALRQKDYPQAAGFFQRAAKLKPDESKPHLNLGETYLKMGLRDQAETQLRAAVVLSPLDYRIRNDLGRLFLDEGREGAAEEQFRASVRVKPNALAYDYLGAINGRRGTLEEAERDFRAALSMDESDSYAHFGLGDIYTLAGRKSEALSQYQSGLVEDPTNAHGLAAIQELRQQIPRAAP